MTSRIVRAGVIFAVFCGGTFGVGPSLRALHAAEGSAEDSGEGVIGAGRVGLENMTPMFHPGPFVAMAVNEQDPTRVAVASQDGRIFWSLDGGYTNSESQAVSARGYLISSLRGYNWRRRAYTTPHTPRGANRLFLALLNKGLPVAKIAMWMNIEDVGSEIFHIALPPDDSGVAVAGSHGVHVSDARRGVFTRVLGHPKPKGRGIMGQFVAIDPADPKHILACTSQGVMASYNGGNTFTKLREGVDESVSKIFWDLANPGRVFAISGGAILSSEDNGKSFEMIHNAKAEVNVVKVGEGGVYIATSEGLQIIGDKGEPETLLKGSNVIGVVPLPEKNLLAATPESIYFVTPDGTKQTLMHTTPSDPVMHLAGNGELVWALTTRAILRIGPRELRRKNPNPPTPRMTLEELERTVNKRFKINRKPSDWHMGERWYAKFLPFISLRLKGVIDRSYSVTYDARYQGSYRYGTTSASSVCCGTPYEEGAVAMMVMAHWDLSTLLFGHISNPNALLERPLRDLNENILREVRSRYSEGVRLCGLLRYSPIDPHVDLLWRQRLEEVGAYLEFMAGRPVFSLNAAEEVP